jgi:hypothetical protein
VALVPCDSCGGAHPPGTARCPVNGTVLRRPKAPPQPPPPSPPQSPAEPPTQSDGSAGGGPDPHAAFLAGPSTGTAVGTGARAMALRVLPGGPTVRLPPGTTVRLGREDSPIAGVCDDNISRHHADVQVETDRAIVVDAGSTNGTFVNDQRLPSAVPQTVAPGDTIRLGTSPPLVLEVVAAS